MIGLLKPERESFTSNNFISSLVIPEDGDFSCTTAPLEACQRSSTWLWILVMRLAVMVIGSICDRSGSGLWRRSLVKMFPVLCWRTTLREKRRLFGIRDSTDQRAALWRNISSLRRLSCLWSNHYGYGTSSHHNDVAKQAYLRETEPHLSKLVIRKEWCSIIPGLVTL